MGGTKSDADHPPAGHAAHAKSLFEGGLESGAWPTVTRSAGDEAHAEMLRAVERGVCVIVSEVSANDGFRLQWSAWRSGDHLHYQAWHYTPKSSWSRGPSFLVSGDSLDELTKLVLAS